MTFEYDVAVYLGTLPKIQNHNLKVQIMKAFAEGAQSVGARVWIGPERQLQNARLAVMIGWIGMNFSGPHIYFRRDIVEHQKKIGGRVMPIDGSCFKFGIDGNKWLRYSLDSVFYNTGEYANKNCNTSRWDMIRTTMNLQLKPWRTDGDHILVCLQRDSGWNAKGFDQAGWVTKTIKIIRSQTDRPVLIRPHPANKIDWGFLNKKFENVFASDSKIRTLEEDLTNAWAAVFYNSSSSVAAILNGIPAYVSDSSAVTWQVANHNTRNINDPYMPEREQWLYDLSGCHWTIEQSRNGEIYKHFLPYLPT